MVGYERLIALAIGYLFGLFQTGYFYGKIRKVDIRKYGSGNAGTMNTLRTFGIKGGIVTLIGDILKAMGAIFLTWFIFHETANDATMLLMEYAGLGAVIGHNFPFYLKFKGGKGIACTGGFILAFHWPSAIVPLLVFVVVVMITRYVSLGSLLGVTALFVQIGVSGQMGCFQVGEQYLLEVYVLGGMFTLLAYWGHRQNILRLLHKEERKIVFKKKGEIHEQTGR